MNYLTCVKYLQVREDLPNDVFAMLDICIDQFRQWNRCGDPDPAGLTWAVLDAGINAAEGVRNEIHGLLPLVPRAGERRTYRLTGPSCTLGDLLYPACSLPPLEPGDGLAIMDTGAYFVPYGTCFSFPRPAIVMIDGGRERLLRRFETFDDMVALEASERRDE